MQDGAAETDTADKDEMIRKLSEENADLHFRLADRGVDCARQYFRLSALLRFLNDFLLDKDAKHQLRMMLEQMDRELGSGGAREEPDPEAEAAPSHNVSSSYTCH